MRDSRNRKQSPPPDIDSRINFIPDWSGDIVKIYGLKNKLIKPYIIIIDQNGDVAGTFEENDGDNNQEIYNLVKALLINQQ